MSEDPRAALRRHGLSPKAAFSQNFLVSTSAVRTIVAAAATAPGEHVVELGPGLGTLTAALIEAGAHVSAIERDQDMIHVLTEDLVPKGLVLRPGDAADVDYAALKREPSEKLCVVGNLPYAITGAILRNLVDSRPHISRAIVMVQREVRDRLIAAPGTKEYGALTVFTTAAFAVQTVLKLPPSAFHPPPKVHSAVVRLDAQDKPRAEETPAFRIVVKAAFEQRRKTLRNALRAAIDERAEVALAKADIDPMRRGETLSVEEFAKLAACVPDGAALES
jgi:16S rRNA (adenine1518-N6/adenine1519-N6)-dimethyltransferase